MFFYNTDKDFFISMKQQQNAIYFHLNVNIGPLISKEVQK